MSKARKLMGGQTFDSETLADSKQQGAKMPTANRAEQWSLRRLLEFLGRPPITLVLWDGTSLRPQAAESVGRVVIKDRRALHRLVANPGFEFGELYSNGRIDVEDNLVDCLNVVYRALKRTAHRITRPVRQDPCPANA